jgi:hypothetical protein
VRLFVAEDGGVSELTHGDQQIVRVAAADLQQARRVRARIRAGADDVAVILDVTISVAGDFCSAQHLAGPADAATVHYAGTVDGLRRSPTVSRSSPPRRARTSGRSAATFWAGSRAGISPARPD